MGVENRRRDASWPGGLVDSVWAFGIVSIAIILAGFVQGGTYDEEATGTQWLNILAPAAVIVAGGVLAGYRLGSGLSLGRLLAGLVAPVPIVAITFVVAVGLSENESDYSTIVWIVLAIYALAEIPLLVAFVARSARRGRASESMPLSPGHGGHR